MFKNLKIAFKDKSNIDLIRGMILFKIISYPIFTKFLTFFLNIALKLNLPITKLTKNTIYRHFCGGETIKQSKPTIKKLWKSNIGTILDFSAEGKESEKDYTKVFNEVISSIKEAKTNKCIPFAVFKCTGITNFSLLQKISSGVDLSKSEQEEKTNFESKVEGICQFAFESNVPVFIDAEESWIQSAIDDIALKMMHIYNKKHTIVYNTIQFYRLDRVNYLKEIIKIAKDKNFNLGIKMVRGAYHEKEINRAIKLKYKIPVHLNKDNTDNDFNSSIDICLKNLDFVSICAGTHNEESCKILIEKMKSYNIDSNNNKVYFSQLLGMSDHISYNIANKKYNVAKYVPYGPVKELIPYLIRRAEENTSISGQVNRELSNLLLERKRRRTKKS